MHLRRAMLLFALVLGVAAMAAALSSPRDNRLSPKRGAEPVPPAEAAQQPLRARFNTAAKARTRTIEVNRRAVVTVSAQRPGLAELDGLGLTAATQPLTPARFDVLASRAGRFEVLYTPAGELKARRVGVLEAEVSPSEPSDPSDPSVRSGRSER